METVRPRPDSLYEARTLLTFWERPFFSSLSKSEPSALPPDMLDAFFEMATELYPWGPQQKDLWERSGGKNKNLPEGEDGEERWRAAIGLIKKGAGPSGGLERLVDTMLEDFLENKKLEHLRDYINSLRPKSSI